MDEDENSLRDIELAQGVGISFVRQYYNVVASEDLAKLEDLYGKDSSFSFNGAIVAIGAEDIKKQYLSLGFKSATFDLESGTFDFAPSYQGGVIVIVSGSVLSEPYKKFMPFTQTFFLAPQGEVVNGLASSYYVANDILRHDASAIVETLAVSEEKATRNDTKFENTEILHSEPKPASSSADDKGIPQEVAKQNELMASSKTGETSGNDVDEIHFEKETGIENNKGGKILDENEDKHISPEADKDDVKKEPSSWASIVSSKKDTPMASASRPVQNTRVKQEKKKPIPSAQGANKQRGGPRTNTHGRHSASIIVKDLDKDITEQQLREVFEAYGKVKSVDLARERRFAFILFESSATVKSVLSKPEISIRGKNVIVQERISHGGSGRQPGRAESQRKHHRGRHSKGGENNGLNEAPQLLTGKSKHVQERLKLKLE